MFRIDNGCLTGFNNIENPNTDLIVPEGVTSIVFGAFEGCKNITSVALPISCKIISANAFLGCESLRSILPIEGIEDIGEQAFRDCQNLIDFKIPLGVTILHKNLFQGCINLKYV